MKQQRQNLRNRYPSIVLRFRIGIILVSWICIILVSWICIILWSVTSLEKSQQQQKRLDTLIQRHPKEGSDDDDKAFEIPGTKVHIPFAGQNDIQVVYSHHQQQQKQSSRSTKGIVILLHACTHSALKFFSPSPDTCPDCVGLSEELRIVRLILQKGYTPVAISSMDQKSGCWSNRDIERIQTVLNQLGDFLLFETPSTIKTDNNHNNNNMKLYAMGASSGGAFAAQLVTHQIVQAAVVMVMSLSSELVDKLQQQSMNKNTIIYLAPMPKDQGTTQRAIQNAQRAPHQIHLDMTHCQALPVTSHYLIQRVPGMTLSIANQLMERLSEHSYFSTSLDATNNNNNKMLVIDPTRSNWRTILSPNNETYWLDRFVLTPGYSPLAKALHRAWAFHEYCSEVVLPALDLFEQQQ